MPTVHGTGSGTVLLSHERAERANHHDGAEGSLVHHRVRLEPAHPRRDGAPVSDSPVPPVAPRKPHTWPRPTGPVEDPYAWLGNREDPDTVAYLEAENAYSGAWFDAHADLVEALYNEIKSRVQETDESVPVRHGPWWYVTRTAEGKAYPVFCRGRAIDAADDVILDCNVEAAGNDYFDVHAVESSPDHSLMAWSSDLDGSEVYTLRVRDLATGQELPDELTGTSSWGGVAWSADGQWLFYARPDAQMRPHEIWRHRLGTPVSADVLVISEPDERFNLDVALTRS
jgi:oligopeptidase B